MSHSSFDDQRSEPRVSDVSGKLPGQVVSVDDHEYKGVVAIDVSRHGLGVLSECELYAGQKVLLKTPTRSIALEVRYCYALQGDLYRVGLRVIGEFEDMYALFRNHGCLAVH